MEFRAFLVKCDGLNEPELFYKKHMLELTWLGFEEEFNSRFIDCHILLIL
jgi:hypothetical protein